MVQAMSRNGLAGPPMENHMDMSHLQMPKHMSVPPQEEPSDLEELEQFAKAFKQRRIKLGFTQVIKHTSQWPTRRSIHSKAKGLLFWFEGRTNTPCQEPVFMVCFCREMWALPWGNCTGTTSARRRSLASKRSTSVSRTCASSNLCWRNGWVMPVSRLVLLLRQPLSSCWFLTWCHIRKLTVWLHEQPHLPAASHWGLRAQTEKEDEYWDEHQADAGETIPWCRFKTLHS